MRIVKVLGVLLISFCLARVSFGADYYTTYYRFCVPEEGTRNWLEKISNDYISLDRILYEMSIDTTALKKTVTGDGTTIEWDRDWDGQPDMKLATGVLGLTIDGAVTNRVTSNAARTTETHSTTAYPVDILGRSRGAIHAYSQTQVNDVLGERRVSGVKGGGSSLTGAYRMKVAQKSPDVAVTYIPCEVDYYVGDIHAMKLISHGQMQYKCGIEVFMGVSADIVSADMISCDEITADIVTMDTANFTVLEASPDIASGRPELYISKDPISGLPWIFFYDGTNFKRISMDSAFASDPS